MEEKRNKQIEEEELNIDELLNVQGGVEDDDKGTTNCGLGCFTGGLGTGTKDMGENDRGQG